MEDTLYGLLDSRYRLAKKFSKEYIKESKMALKDYELASFDELVDTSTDKELWNKLQVPYIFSTIESGIPALFDSMPSVVMQAGGKKDNELTGFADSVWAYLKRELKLQRIVQDVGFTFMLTGMGSMRYDWITETEEVEEVSETPVMNEQGEPVVNKKGEPVVQEFKNTYEVITKSMPSVDYNRYNRVFFSPESQFIVDDTENKIPYIIIKEQMTPDEVEYLYDTKVKATELLDMQEFDKSMEDDTDEDLEKAGIKKDDITRIKVFTYYGGIPKKHLDKKDKKNWKPSDVYKCVFTNADKKILKKLERVGKKPVLLVDNYGSPDKFWKFGEAKVLRELEQDVSLGRSIIADYRDKLATKIAMPHLAEVDEESFKSPKEFTIVKFMGQQYPQYITPPPVPETVITSINMSREDIQMASGQLDISRGGTSSTVDTATGQKIFQSVHEKRIARKRGKIGSLMTALAENLLVLCAENWDISEFVKISDLDEQTIKENQLIEKLAQIGKGYDLVIDMESVTNNKETESAQAIALYREMKDDVGVNQDELRKYVVKVGFRQKDPERFLSNEITPEQMVKSLEQMVKDGIIDPQTATQYLQQVMQSAEGGGNQMGRPMTQDPSQVAQKRMPGADNTQITAQNEAAHKQQGVSK